MNTDHLVYNIYIGIVYYILYVILEDSIAHNPGTLVAGV